VYLLEQAKEARQARQQNAKKAMQAEAKMEAAVAVKAESAIAKTAPAVTYSKAKLDQMRKDLTKMESQIAALELEKTRLEADLCKPNDAGSIAALGKQLNAVTQKLAETEGQWLALGELLS
jgi:ATP-binding cassette, subfamily F, member 3